MPRYVNKGVVLMSSKEKCALLDDLLRYAYDNTDSYEDVPEFAADLLYVVGAIVQDDYCEFTEMDSRQLVKLLREHYPNNHPIWQYLRDDDDRHKTPEQLDDKYNPDGGGEHPVWTRNRWQAAVANEETLTGYWFWVAYCINEQPCQQPAEPDAEPQQNGD